RHVSRSGSKAIADWVKAGGRLFATAGAGMYDEFNQPNKLLRDLLGVEETKLEHAAEDITREKEHLPFAKALDRTLVARGGEPGYHVFGARSRFTFRDAEASSRFGDGSPAITERVNGKGWATYCGL